MNERLRSCDLNPVLFGCERRRFLCWSILLSVACFPLVWPAVAVAEPKPNVIVIFIDDMGYADLSCYGNSDLETKNIDRLAKEGTRFTQFYVASPICSPSRVALTTGQYPTRFGITGHFASRKQNRARGMPDYLDPSAPAIARGFQQAGYATAHFGKWHMGGGRDVDDAPLPQEYGFEESLVSFEGLGDRILQRNHSLSRASARLGHGSIHYVSKHRNTETYVDRCIDFMRCNGKRPLYLHLWLNDVHDPFRPTQSQLDKFSRFRAEKYVQQYYAVIDEMDRQIGRLLDELDQRDLTRRTLVVLASDNGPTAWPKYYREQRVAPGRTGGLRGRKWSLYEGGIREPLLVRWPDRVAGGAVNSQTIISAIDLLPTLYALAKLPAADAPLDGEDLSAAMLGQPSQRKRPLYWDYGRSPKLLQPGLARDRSPNLAMRLGRWKFLINDDGSRPELYDLEADPAEQTNLVDSKSERAAAMRKQLSHWLETTANSANDPRSS